MAQPIKTNCRQIIERGNEISKYDLERCKSIYAVSRRDPDSREPIWGLLYFDQDSRPITYNVAARHQWAEAQLITLDHLRFYEPTQMEIKFAEEHITLHNLEFKHHRTEARIEYYQQSRWHRIASRLETFFSF